MNLVYKHEQPLFVISLLISIIFWLLLILGTVGTALLWLFFLWLFYLFAQSGLISYLKGTAVQVGSKQFPDLYSRVESSCRKLGVKEIPDIYLLHGDGIFNAFATRFRGRNFMVLFSDVVDALDTHPNAINFYIGHELGHIHRNHLFWAPVLAPGNFLPILGAAYSRACEYSSDMHGLACCPNVEDACRGLSALAAGGKRFETLDIDEYVYQTAATGGFWMSFHELTASYPWLVKRMERLRATAEGREPKFPRRRLRAWLLALFTPSLGAGSGAALPLMVIAIIGILAAVAIPAYEEFEARSTVAEGFNSAAPIRQKVIDYASKSQKWPSKNKDIGVDENIAAPNLQSIQVGPNGAITLTFAGPPPSLTGKTMTLHPQVNGEQITWSCSEGSLESKYLPPQCSP